MAGHPLRPASHLCLGEPLPHQRANGAQAHLQAVACKQRPPFTPGAAAPVVLSGISPSFDRLSRSRRQVTYVLLTRAPLYSWSCPHFPARLACVRHAASVRSEPGSNSPVEICTARSQLRPGTQRVPSRSLQTRRPLCTRFPGHSTDRHYHLVFKDRPHFGGTFFIPTTNTGVNP